MKIGICNVPLRSNELKTTYPPLGALAITQSLRSAGYDTSFYDINFFRPSDEEIKNYFLEHKLDIVGISATVATSYKFVKKLVSIIKSALPEAVIVVGGALTASSEIILKFNDVDFCVVGEGEKVIVNLVNFIVSNGMQKSEERLKEIKGLYFLNEKGDCIFTGYERQLSVDEIQDPDYEIIEKYSDINQYIIDPFFYEQFGYDERSFEKKRTGKRLATVVSSRGCVNRCTFCYRGQKGIRIFPVDRIIRNIKYLMEKHNVGFISFGDENFGASKTWIEEFVEKVKPLEILYRIIGVCCENINLPLLKKLKMSGCVEIHYGFESGSNRMLRVMEKRSSAQLNEKVAKWTHQAGLGTVPHLLIGMPGETYETIKETTDFINRITEFCPRRPVIGINVLVPLPGAPVYEYARLNGFLGKTLEDEEKYLLRVSDQSGVSMRLLNMTSYPYAIVQGWVRCISSAAQYNYCKKNNLPSKTILAHPVIYHLRYILMPFFVMFKVYREDKKLFLKYFVELLISPVNKMFNRAKFGKCRYVSIRTLVSENNNRQAEDLRQTDEVLTYEN